MTHDNSESPVARETTELYPFSSSRPDRTGFPDGPVVDVPAMEELPVMERLPDAVLPDPGYPEMSAAPPSPPRMPADEPDGEEPLPGPRAPRSSAIQPTWQAAPYVAPRAPAAAPPLQGPAVPWSEVRSGADRADRPERADRAERPDRPERADRPEHADRGDRAERADRAERPDRVDHPDDGEPLIRPLSAPVPPAADIDDLTSAGFNWFSDDPSVVRETAETLTSDLLLPDKRATPDPGWRRTLYRSTGGLIRIGESAATMRRRHLVSRIRTPVASGHHRVAVLSLKGGVGKTTATVGLGSTLASLRGDRVIAVDGNPDRGTLSDKVRLETPATIRDLLNDRDVVRRYADIRAFTSQAPSRLEILASDRDPAVSVAFSADDYRTVADVLEHYYSICITDCGTGLLHSAMAGILELADQIVLVSSPSVDGARSASATLDWLEAHGYGDLVRGGVVVLSAVRRRTKSAVDVDRLQQHFAGRCRAVVRIPFDAHLEEGAEVELELLSAETADAYLELAALVADSFGRPRRSLGGATPRFPLA
jgi:MinD-like ATPase involved in chromosome partitioning or flagellar assembly